MKLDHWRDFSHRFLISSCAAFLLILFFVFMAGYYWGKKSAIEQLSHQFDQESFADRVYSSMYMMYDAGEEDDEREETPLEMQESERSSV